MLGLGAPEIIIIALVILALFGYKKLPDAARAIGRSARIFKAETKGLRDDPTPRDLESKAEAQYVRETPPPAAATPPAGRRRDVTAGPHRRAAQPVAQGAAVHRARCDRRLDPLPADPRGPHPALLRAPGRPAAAQRERRVQPAGHRAAGRLRVAAQGRRDLRRGAGRAVLALPAVGVRHAGAAPAGAALDGAVRRAV